MTDWILGAAVAFVLVIIAGSFVERVHCEFFTADRPHDCIQVNAWRTR